MVDPYHLRCRYKYEELSLLVKFDLQLYKLENNSYLVDFKNVGTTHLSSSGSNAKEALSDQELVDRLREDVFQILQQENEEEQERGRRDKLQQSVYPFLDVCSKLITDIV